MGGRLFTRKPMSHAHYVAGLRVWYSCSGLHPPRFTHENHNKKAKRREERKEKYIDENFESSLAEAVPHPSWFLFRVGVHFPPTV